MSRQSRQACGNLGRRPERSRRVGNRGVGPAPEPRHPVPSWQRACALVRRLHSDRGYPEEKPARGRRGCEDRRGRKVVGCRNAASTWLYVTWFATLLAALTLLYCWSSGAPTRFKPTIVHVCDGSGAYPCRYDRAVDSFRAERHSPQSARPRCKPAVRSAGPHALYARQRVSRQVVDLCSAALSARRL